MTIAGISTSRQWKLPRDGFHGVGMEIVKEGRWICNSLIELVLDYNM
jgi:hypothetical protein